jgi:hypothetical protein
MGMNQGSSVLAVVDGIDDVPVVWWVDLGWPVNRMSRLCGAWVLDRHDIPKTLHVLTVTRIVVSTVAGWSLMNKHQVTVEQRMDSVATLAAVAAIRDELQRTYQQAVESRKNGRVLAAPRWPQLPDVLDVETADAPSEEPRCRRALGISRWFEQLCIAWDAIEGQRLARPYLSPIGGPAARALPVALHPLVENP